MRRHWQALLLGTDWHLQWALIWQPWYHGWAYLVVLGGIPGGPGWASMISIPCGPTWTSSGGAVLIIIVAPPVKRAVDRLSFFLRLSDVKWGKAVTQVFLFTPWSAVIGYSWLHGKESTSETLYQDRCCGVSDWHATPPIAVLQAHTSCYPERRHMRSLFRITEPPSGRHFAIGQAGSG